MPASPPPPAAPRGAFLRHFLCRVSGLPADALDDLASPACADLLERLAATEGALRAGREEVSARLHAAVQAVEDPALRRALLALRRDLFNLRTPRPGSGAGLDGADRAAVDAFRARLEERDRLVHALDDAHGEAVRTARARFRARLDDDGFQKGLLISSRALFDAQARYRRDDAPPDARLAKTERGLLRYFARTCMKATPFGTLCSVVPGRVTEAGGAPALVLHGDPMAKRSATRLNKALCALLTDALLRRPALRRRLPVETNPTLADEDGGYAFLAALRGREVFVRLPRSPAVARVVARAGAGRGASLASLADALAADPDVEATAAEAEAYVGALVAGGLLRLDTGVREQEVDWDLSLRRTLEGLDDADAARVAALLASLRAGAERYDGADAAGRRAVLDGARAEINATLAALGARGRFHALPFMEDATAALEARLPDTPALRRLERDLAGLVHLLRRAAYPRGEMAELRHFFARHYPPGTGSVPLLRFYEDFHREHQKGHLARLAGEAPAGADAPYDRLNPFGLPLLDEIRRGQRRLVDTVSRRWAAAPDAAEIELRREDVEAAFAGIPPLPDGACSVGLFGEIVPGPEPDAPLRLVSPGRLSIGYGRLFSRFVYLLPEGVLEDLRAAAAGPGARRAEIGGDGGHNANLHPPMLGWEIRYPTAAPGIAPAQLAPGELEVAPDPEDPGALVLRHAASGERVVPLDLGFIVREARPPLHQLLTRFMPPADHQHRWPAYPGHVPLELREPAGGDAAPGAEPAADGEAWRRVVYRPRIVYEGTIVLTRRSWRVPAWDFPQQAPWETDAAFLRRADAWRRAHGMPREVYVRVWPDFLAGAALGEIGTRAGPPGEGGEGEEEGDGAEEAPPPPGGRRGAGQARGTLNLRKPQYVDFASPLLVGLLGRLVGDLDAFVAVVEERYPDPADLPRAGGRPYAVEQVFQLELEPAAGAGGAAEGARAG